MTYISDEYRFAFFAAPATGSSAVIKALSDQQIGQYWPERDVLRNGRRIAPKKHSTFRQLKMVGLDNRIKDYTKFVGVRNVFAWHVAKFLRNKTTRQNTIKNKKSWVYTELTEIERKRYITEIEKHGNMDFEAYLHDILDRHEKVDFHEDFHKDMDVYLHQEILADDFSQFAKALNLPEDLIIHPFNVTGAMGDGKSYKDYYDTKTVDFVYQKNEPFFVRFPEYDFEGLDLSKAKKIGTDLHRAH